MDATATAATPGRGGGMTSLNPQSGNARRNTASAVSKEGTAGVRAFGLGQLLIFSLAVIATQYSFSTYQYGS
jgi:hypothetical protein